MLHYVFVAFTWLAGFLGVGGAVAFAAACLYLGPAAVMAFVGPLISRFLACAKCVAICAAVLATLAAYWVGHHQAAAECRADELNSRIAAQEADVAAATKAKHDETQRANKIESDANAQRNRDLKEIDKLKRRRKAGCLFDDDDAGTGSRGLLPARPFGAKPSGSAGDAVEGAAGAAPGRKLSFPMVWRSWMQGKGRSGDASPDGQ